MACIQPGVYDDVHLEMGTPVKCQYRCGVVGYALWLKRQGRKKWQRHVEDVVERLVAALKPDDVVLGGGNGKKLKPLPLGTRAGANANAFLGGFRLWEGEGKPFGRAVDDSP